MFKNNSPIVQALVIADAAILGGVATLILVNTLLTQIMYRLVTADAQAEILNVLDHLLPYYFGFAAIAITVTIATTIALGLKTRSWRIASLPFVGLVGIVAVFLLV